MIHLDLFSGIGGFAYAADQVWPGIAHIFVEFDPFCQEVLKKHWSDSYIFTDIKHIVNKGQIDHAITNTNFGQGRPTDESKPIKTQQLKSSSNNSGIFILTGGFPCQPYSAAGLRKGTADERHLWPEMLRVIQLTKPTWVIAENVRGILTWNNGVVFEQVCTDLEAEGYEVQTFIIPAVAVNAPHRRDRVWIIGHAKHHGLNGTEDAESSNKGTNSDTTRPNKLRQPERTDSLRQELTADSESERDGGSASERRLSGKRQMAEKERQGGEVGGQGQRRTGYADWERDWTEVAAELCSLDDELPVELDGLKLSKSQHRKEQLKAYGNAIVPAVAVEIMRGMT